MDPFWAKYRAVDPYLRPGYAEPGEREHRDLAGADERDPQGVALHQLRRVRLGVQRDGVRPGLPRPAGAREGDALRRRRRATGRSCERLEQVNGKNGIWQCTRCYFCNERCPKGVDPRDAIAKLGAESIKEGIDRDMGAKHAKWFVHSARTTGWLREMELVPHTQGVVDAIRETRFALKLARDGKVPVPFPPHVAKDVKEARALYDLVQEQGRERLRRHRPGREGAGARDGDRVDGDRDPYGEGSFPRAGTARRGGAP